MLVSRDVVVGKEDKDSESKLTGCWLVRKKV